MSGTTASLRSASTNWSFPERRKQRDGVDLVWAMLDVIDAAEALVWTAPPYRTIAQSEDVIDALARFREVAG